MYVTEEQVESAKSIRRELDEAAAAMADKLGPDAAATIQQWILAVQCDAEFTEQEGQSAWDVLKHGEIQHD